MARGDALLNVARARVVVPASGAVWVTAAALHAARFSGFETGLCACGMAAVIYGLMSRRATRHAARPGGADQAKRAARHARQAGSAALAAGAWLTAAAVAGPLAGPDHAMTIVWAGGTLTGLIVLHRHEAVREARRWREARRGWLGTAHRYGLHGSHLLGHERTRLGEVQELDVTGTGKLASQLASSSLAERIAQDLSLPVSRVQVTTGRIAGRVRISIRRKDPWKHPIIHPVLNAAPDLEMDLELPVPATIREPLPVGQDPETGDPLNMILWDEDGAKNILIVAKKRAGKTTLLSDLRERITAAPDAVLWNINLSKSVEDREWAPACHQSAAGRHDKAKALAMLRAARRLIDDRGATPRDTPVFQPTGQDPLVVLVIDESDALVTSSPAAKALLDYIGSKNGSEGVAAVLAGQRGTTDWIPAGFRANVDYVAIGKVNRRGEMMHAAGDMGLTLPDMATYGEGNAGVWVIAEVGGGYEVGRTFNLRELTDIRRIAAERSVREPSLAGASGAAGSHAGEPVPAGNFQPSSPGIDHLDQSLEDAVPDELRDQLRRLDEKNAATRQTLHETGEIIASLPSVDPAKLAESTAARWRQAAEQTEIPPDAREKLMTLLAGEGTSGRKALEHFAGVKRARLMLWLNRLRYEGVAYVEGKGPAARWRLTSRQDGDKEAADD